MLWRKPPEDLAKVGVEGSNPFARSINSLKSRNAGRDDLGGSRSPTQNKPKSDAGKPGESGEALFMRRSHYRAAT